MVDTHTEPEVGMGATLLRDGDHLAYTIIEVIRDPGGRVCGVRAQRDWVTLETTWRDYPLQVWTCRPDPIGEVILARVTKKGTFVPRLPLIRIGRHRIGSRKALLEIGSRHEFVYYHGE